MSEPQKYADIPELSDVNAPFHLKSEYTYIINAEKYQQTGELEVKRVLKKHLSPEASASYVFFKREGCHGYPLNEQDLYIKDHGYVGPFQMDNRACKAFLNHVAEKYPEMKNYITGTGTGGYLNFVKKYPDKEKLKEIIEDYALSGYYKGRPGKPYSLATRLASHLKVTDENGAPDATRLPLHVIASLPTGIIARGNGSDFYGLIPKINQNTIDDKCGIWIKSNLGRNAYAELKQIDYLTPEILNQYQTLNLSGAENLQQKYKEAVSQKENDVKEKMAHLSRVDIMPKDNLKVSQMPAQIEIPRYYYENQTKLANKLRAKDAKKKLKKKLKPNSVSNETNETAEEKNIPVNNNVIQARLDAERSRS